MRFARYIPLQSVIADLYRDLGLDDISEADVYEWAANALEHISVKPMLDVNTVFLNVENYKCELPVGLKDVLQIAKHNNLMHRPKNPNNMFFEVDDNKCGCSKDPVPNDCGCSEPKEKKLCVCQSFVNNWGWFFVFDTDKRRREKFDWTLVMPTNNNFFKLGMCDGIADSPFDEYSVENGKVLFSFKEGFIAMSYTAPRVDEDGYPLMPDDISAREAVNKYVTMKYMARQWYLGREGYQDKMIKAEQDWHWYCKQFKMKAVMPDEDEYRKISLKEMRMIPRFSKDWFGYIALADSADSIMKQYGLNMARNISVRDIN